MASGNITLDEKFTDVLADSSATQLFTEGGVTDDSTKMIILRKLFIRSGFDVQEIVSALKALKSGVRVEHLITRITNIINSDKADINTVNTIKFLTKVTGDNVYGEMLAQPADTPAPAPAPVTPPTFEPISEEEDLTDAIIDACLNYSKTCMAFMKMGYNTRDEIRNQLLNRYLR